jgi:hypothetical protein
MTPSLTAPRLQSYPVESTDAGSESQAPLKTRCQCQWPIANLRPGDRAGVVHPPVAVILCRHWHVLLTLAPLRVNSLPGSPVCRGGSAMSTARGLVAALFTSDTF